MAINFRIQRRRHNGNLHLNLFGDFDGSSAMELLEELKKHADETTKIYVHTCFIKKMAPFGEEVFKKRFRFSTKAPEVKFTGKHRNLRDLEACT